MTPPKKQCGFHDGGCGCGHVRYRLLAPALIVHACHCRMCQRLTGGSNAVNILIEAEHVRLLSGDTTDVLASTPSGQGQLITRCKACHIAVWSEYFRFSGRFNVPIRFVRAGTLDRPDAFPPDVHIFVESKQAHVILADGIPKFPAFYSVSEVWTEPSKKRLRERASGPNT